MNLASDPAAIGRLVKAGGPNLARQMVRLFLESTPVRIAGASAAARLGNWSEVERAFHSMKSSAGYLGLAGLAEQAARIEQLASGGRAEDLAPLLQEMSASLPAIQTAAKSLTDSL
jgi:two-component system, sensor histidine kinase and response regulator